MTLSPILSTYLRERAQRALSIQVCVQQTTAQVQRVQWRAAMASCVTSTLALAISVASLMLALSAAHLLMAYGLVLASQALTVWVSRWGAKRLRESASRVRREASECIGLINVSPAAAVLDARWPYLDVQSAQRLHPWLEVRRGLSAAVAWTKLAKQYQKAGNETLLSLLRTFALQFLKGPVRFLTILTLIVDLIRAVLRYERVQQNVALLDLSKLMRREGSLFNGAHMRDLTLLSCLERLPNHDELMRWRRRVEMQLAVAPANGPTAHRPGPAGELQALREWENLARNFDLAEADRLGQDWLSEWNDQPGERVAEIVRFAAAARRT